MVYQLPALPDGVGRRCLVLDGRVHLPVRVVRDLVDVAADAAQLVFDLPERLDGGRIMFLLLDVQASLQQLYRFDDGEGYRLVPFLGGGADHRGFLLVHHEMHLDGALRAAAFAASFTHYSFFSSIGLRHSGCCSSAAGRGRLRARFMYMNRLACLPSI